MSPNSSDLMQTSIKRNWFRTSKGSKITVIFAFTIIPLILLFVFTYLPFGKMVQYSFYNMRYIGERRFVGLQNYRELFTRKDIIGTLLLSLYYIVGAIIQIILALFLATLLSKRIRAAGLFKGLIFFP